MVQFQRLKSCHLTFFTATQTLNKCHPQFSVVHNRDIWTWGLSLICYLLSTLVTNCAEECWLTIYLSCWIQWWLLSLCCALARNCLVTLLVTGWLEMLMLTGEGVGMALAHDLRVTSSLPSLSTIWPHHTSNIQTRNKQIFQFGTYFGYCQNTIYP